MFFTYLEEGDEVILIQPFFAIFKPMIELTGAKVVAVDLLPNHNGGWDIDFN